MKLTLINSSQKPMPRKFIQEWCEVMVNVLKKRKLNLSKNMELSIVFLNPQQARKLNMRYRGKSYATDVLSFDGNPDINQLGELVICPQVIERQAKEHQLTLRQELGYMVLHGVLHLLGYDHEAGKKQADEMFKIQDEAFDQLCRKFWA